MSDLHTQSEALKLGWVAGFYDALTDDGLKYLDDFCRYGVNGDRARADFMAGYSAGREARRGPSEGRPATVKPLPIAA